MKSDNDISSNRCVGTFCAPLAMAMSVLVIPQLLMCPKSGWIFYWRDGSLFTVMLPTVILAYAALASSNTKINPHTTATNFNNNLLFNHPDYDWG